MLNLTTHFNMNLTYQITLHFDIQELALTYSGDKNSVIKVQNASLINKELSVVTAGIKEKVNKLFEKGYSFSGLLYDTPLCWLDMSMIYFIPNYGDYFIWGAFTPGYDPSLSGEGNDNPYGPWTKLLLHPEEFL